MKWKQIVGVLCAAAVISGCSQHVSNTKYTGEKAEQSAYQDNLNAISPQAYSNVDGLELEPGTYISIIGKETDTAYWKAVAKGVEQAVTDLNEHLGYTGNDKIKVTYNAPEAGEDIDEQVNILDEELSRYPDVIAIASIDADEGTVQFDQATENGIPIVAFDSGNDYQGIVSTCKTDNQEAARTGASKLCDEIGDAGQILVLAKNSHSASAKERLSGIEEEIAQHDQVEIAEVLYYDQIQDMKKSMAAERTLELPEGSPEITVDKITDGEVLNEYLAQHPDIKGILGTNSDVTEWALETLQANAVENKAQEKKSEAKNSKTVQDAQEEAGVPEEPKEEDQENVQKRTTDDIALVGFDAEKKELEALKSGEIKGLVVQNPFGMGYATVVAAARTVLELGNEAKVDTGYIWVTKENMDSDSIKNMLY